MKKWVKNDLSLTTLCYRCAIKLGPDFMQQNIFKIYLQSRLFKANNIDIRAIQEICSKLMKH